MKWYLSLVLAAILTNNFVLSKFLGICPFLGVSKQLKTASGMGIAVTFPINKYLLEQFNLEYLQTIVFILVIAALVQLIEIALKKYMPPLYNALGIYLPLITTNCAVLGVVVLNVEEGYNFAESIANTFGAGIGFLLAMVMFAGVRERMESSDIPEKLKGLPITLVAASLTSMSFLGFTGVVEGMLG